MWFTIGFFVGMASGFVIFRLYWVQEINAGRAALAQAKAFVAGAAKKL